MIISRIELKERVEVLNSKLKNYPYKVILENVPSCFGGGYRLIGKKVDGSICKAFNLPICDKPKKGSEMNEILNNLLSQL